MPALVLCIKDCNRNGPRKGKVYTQVEVFACPQCGTKGVTVEGFPEYRKMEEYRCWKCEAFHTPPVHGLVRWKARCFVPLNDPDFKGEDVGDYRKLPATIEGLHRGITKEKA